MQGWFYNRSVIGAELSAMSVWVKAEKGLLDDPRISFLMGAMKWDQDKAIVKIIRFRWWCVDHAENGDLSAYNDDQIASGAGVLAGTEATDFVKAMLEARWLEREPYFRVRNWWNDQGAFLTSRYKKTPEKWHVIRDLYVSCDGNGSGNGSGNPKEKRRKEKSNNPPTPFVSDLPKELDTAEFRAAWEEWVAHRTEIRHPMTERATRMALGDCEKLGAPRAVAAIRHSIACGYRGIFEAQQQRQHKQASNGTLLPADQWKNQPYRG